jgi:hypothetical protein
MGIFLFATKVGNTKIRFKSLVVVIAISYTKIVYWWYQKHVRNDFSDTFNSIGLLIMLS